MRLIASFSSVLGGAERVLVDVATVLEDCVLACPEGPLAVSARAEGVRVISIPERSLSARGGVLVRIRAMSDLAGHARELRRLVADLEPELVVAWGMRSMIASLALRPASVSDTAHLLRTGRPTTALMLAHHDFLPDRATAVAVRRAAACADGVIVNSRAVADDLDPDGRLGTPVTVIHPGVGLASSSGPEPADPPEILVLGALVGWKRPDLALEAFALARREQPRLRLRIVGSPLKGGEALAGELARRASQPDLAGAVELSGSSSNPAADLARASCLLHCAVREPYGLVVAEALAAGRPVVVPDAAGPAEIVDDTCALRYPPGDAAAAARALLALLGDRERARKMGFAGRDRAGRHLGRERMRAEFTRALTGGSRRPTPDDTPADLALVTVTHNSGPELRALLDSAARHLPGVRVVVVDCASADDSVAIAGSHPAAVSVPADANLGFGRACNLGLSAVTEPVTVFLNPDVELLDGSLQALAGELLGGDAAPRLLAPLVLSSDGSRQDTVHPAPGSLAERLRILMPPAAAKRRLGTALAPWHATEPRQVGWAVGCALAGRTDALRQLGPFSEAIFMYGEDMELGLRAARQGVSTWFWPHARVLHHQAHASAGAFGGEPFSRLARARHEALAGERGERVADADDRAQALLFATRIAAKRLLGRDADRERHQLAAVRAASRPSPSDGAP